MHLESWTACLYLGWKRADYSGTNIAFSQQQLWQRQRTAISRFSIFAALLCCLAAVPQKGYAQTPAGFSNFDDITSGWLLCSGICAGGNEPTQIVQKFGITKPSLDGKSMKLSISGDKGTNNGWYLNAGVHDSDTTFKLDMWFNIPSKLYIQALEFDQFQYLLAGDGGVTSNTRLYFGTQCINGAHWQVWDSSGIGWVDTGAACSFTVSSTTFNHLVISVHRLTGDTSCVDGRPCMYYDSITLNGKIVVANQKTNSGALPAGWGEQTGLMIQLDTNSTCGSACTITEYVDKGNFTIN